MANEKSTRIVLYIQFTNNKNLELSLPSLADANATIQHIVASGQHNTRHLYYLKDAETNRVFGINLEHIIYMHTMEIK